MSKGFNLTAEINLRGPSNIRQIVSDMRRQLGSIDTNINVQINQQTNRQINTINRSFQDFNRTLQQTRALADSTSSSITQLGNAARTLSNNLQNIPQTMNQLAQGANQTAQANTRAAQATGAATSEFAEFGRQSALAVRRFAAFATVTGIIYKVSNAITNSTQDFIEFNKQLVKVSQVTDTPVESLGFLVSNISKLSTGLGVASQDLIDVAQTLAQAGLNARDTSVALQALARSALAPSFDDLNSTVEGSIALMRQFGISAGQLENALGSINAVSAKFAVEASDIVTAISRTGGVFAAASKGVSQGTDALNEFIAVFTSVRATTRESAETIATGLRTIFTRIQREDTINALKSYGVALTDLEGKFVGPYEAVRRLSEGLSTLDSRDIRFSRIVEELGGFRQIGKVIPLIQQFTTAQQALAVAQQGQGSLAKDAATAQLSLANQIVKVREEFDSLIRSIGQSQGFQDLIRLGLDLSSAFIAVADAAKGALPALTAIFAIKGFQALTQFTRGFAGGIRTGAQNQRLNSGGYVHHFARGGVVPGTGNRDSVPAMLTPGEFVLNKKTTKAIGANRLHGINRLSAGGDVRRFRAGGPLTIQDIQGAGKRGFGKKTIQQMMNDSNGYIEPDDTVRANIVDRKIEPISNDIKQKLVEKMLPQRGGRRTSRTLKEKIDDPVVSKTSLNSTYNALLGTAIEEYIIESQGATRLLPGKYSSATNVPIDVMIGDQLTEIKFKKESTNDAELLSKLFRYNFETGKLSFGKLGKQFAENIRDEKSLDLGIDLGQITLLSGKEAREDFDRYINQQYTPANKDIAFRNLGGRINKLKSGGVVQRRVGYIDYDVIANPANKNTIEKGMESVGVAGPRLYTDKLTQMAVAARKNSSLNTLKAVYGVAGSGKTTLARGSGTDSGSLRKTERFPILTPEDIQKATDIIVLSSSVSKDKLDQIFAQTDRTYTISSTTPEEQSRVKSQRLSRDATGIGLEGRQPGVTSGVSTDTAVGEALLADRIGNKSVVLGRTESGRLRRKSGNELVDIIKKQIGFTWGSFSPMTAGHESIMDSAAAMGISPEDFIYLVGANEGIKAGDPSSYRTAVFDQDFRVLLAKAGAGARGATILPKPRDFEVPQAFDVSSGQGRRKVLIPGKGSTTFVADKTPEQTAKYKEAGYNVANIERSGGISGTMVRDLIMAGDMARLQQVLSPGVYEVISNNIGRLQNRANVLPSIIEQVKRTQGLDLETIEKQIKALGISRIDSKKVASDPEYAAKVSVLEELRNKRDKIKSAGSFAPYRLLADLAQSEPEQYGLDFSMSRTGTNVKPVRTVRAAQKAFYGGLIKKFAIGGAEGEKLSRADILKVLTPAEAAKVAGIRSDEVYKLLGSRSLDAKQQALREAIEAEYIKKTNRQRGSQQGLTTRLSNQDLVFGAAGMFGQPSDGKNIKIESDRLNRAATVRVISGVLDSKKAQELDALFTNQIKSLSSQAAKIIDPDASSDTQENINTLASIQGGLLEEVVKMLGGPGSVKGLGFDFPNGLQRAAKYFGLPEDIPTDLKRTLSGPSTIKDNIITYLKNVRGYAGGGKVDYYSLEKNSGFGSREFDMLVQYAKTNDLSLDEFQKYLQQRSANKQQNSQLMMNSASLLRALTPETPRVTQKQLGLAEQLRGEPDAGYRPMRYATGGSVSKFASGGYVPALLTPGEAVIGPKLAKKIGYSRLNKMNYADKYATGGEVSIVPGSGNSDTFGPVPLPVGSFVIRKKATQALGYNKGGAIGTVRKFQDGGDVFEFPEKALAKPTKDAVNALEQAIENMMAKVVSEIAKANPSISIDDAYAQASSRVLPESQFLPGTQKAAETGDSGAGQIVYQQQQQQINSLIKQIRSTNNNISVADARAAAEQRVSQAWGGLIQKVKQTTQSQQQLNTSTQQLTTAQNNSTAQQEANDTGAGATGGRGGLNFSGLGTALAFTGPMLAQQIGDSIGGTAGAGIAGGATSFSTYASIGAQFGQPGAIVGALVGLVASIDGFNAAVAQKESELASIELDKTIERSAQVRERFAKTGRPEDAGVLVDNFKKIQDLEEKRSAANIRAEQPGMVSKALNTISFGYLGGDRRSSSQIAGSRASEQQLGAQDAQAFISSMIAAGKGYDEVTAILQKKGVALSALYGSIAEANPEYQAEVVEIRKLNMSEQSKQQAIELVKKKYVDQARTLTNAEFADAARAKASQKLAQKINVVSASITRTFDNLNQAINASSAGLKQASDDLQRIISGSTGFTANLDNLNVLQNPRAFNRQQQNDAIGQASQFAGRDRGFIEQLARFSLDAEDIVAGGAARAQQQGSNQAVVANDIINQLTQKIDSVFGQNILGDQLRNSLKEQIQESLKRGEEIDVQKLLEESGLSNQLQASKQAFDALQNSLKLVQEAMNFAANAANEYGKLQQNIRDNQASYQNTITQSGIALKEALGKRVGVGERLQARRGVAATKAGIDPTQLNAVDLTSRRDSLQKEINAIRSALQNTANTFDTTIPKADARFTALTKKLAETESALKATEQGLESLPGTIEANINDIIGEIGRIQQELSGRQQAAGSFAEQLVSSTPQELLELNGTFNLLNNTLNGQITTINQSQAAQQAYFQALQNGSSQQEAYAAAQQAFAGQTKNALSMFNQLSQLSGLQGSEINNIRADLLENFAKGQGSGLQNNPMFQKMLELLRKPPEQSAEIQALQGVLKVQQAELSTTTQKLNEGILSKQKDILDSANQAFIKALNDVRVKFDTEQLRGAGFGLGTPGQATTATRLASGGVVYASDGTYVNYQSRGTDTVPAMLTPGEFVVNAKATKNNLGLLSAINSSAGNGKTFSRGGVVYAAGGGNLDNWLEYLPLDLLNNPLLGVPTAGAIGVGTVKQGPAALSKLRGLQQGMSSFGSNLSWLFNEADILGGLGKTDFKALRQSLGAKTFQLLEKAVEAGSYGAQTVKMDFQAIGSGQTFSNILDEVANFGLTEGSRAVRSANMSGAMGDAARNTLAASGNVRTPSTVVQSLGRILGSSRGMGQLFRYLGPALGAAQGAMADTDKTKRGRLTNTLLGAATGSGTTMGDVGATSITGSQMGGNLVQAGLTTAQYMSMGFPPPAAAALAATAMTTQEVVGYFGDIAETQQSEARLGATDQRQRTQGRSTTSSDPTENRALKLVAQRGQQNSMEGFNSAEANWITQRVKFDNTIRNMDRNNDGKADNIWHQEKFDKIKELSDAHNKARKNIFTKSTFGWWGENKTDTKTEAEIDAAVQKERTYQAGITQARTEIATPDADARAQAQADREARTEEAKQLGLTATATWSEVVQARVAKLDADRKAKVQEAQAQQRARAKDIGLKEDASMSEIEAAEAKRNSGLGLSATASKEEVDARRQQQADFQQKYGSLNEAAGMAIRTSKDLPPNTYSAEWEKAKEERGYIADRINSLRTEVYNPNNPFYKSKEDFEKYRTSTLSDLYAELDEQNNIINQEDKILREKYGGLDYTGKRKLWDEYNAGQAKEAKIKQREEKQANIKLAKQQSDQIRAVAKYVNLKVPDKFSNPGVFLTWRKNLQQRLQKDFPFGSRTPEALGALGIKPDMIQALYNPFNNDELVSIYSSMLQNAPLSPRASQIVTALRTQQSNIGKKTENDPRLQQIISSASPAEQKQIIKQFETTFVKSARQIGVFKKLVSRFSNLNPAQQKLAQANLKEQAVRQGLIDPRANNDFNISRLNALGGGNIAGFLYPTQETQNQAIRVSNKVATKSSGGIVYASNGMLVPYEPKGTDTVPAMLTPGEFVVNRAATQKHLPLLQSINRSRGGQVEYLQAGGGAGMTTDPSKYVDGVLVEPTPDKRIDEVLMNAKESTKLGYINKDNIETNTKEVPTNNIASQEKLDFIINKLKILEECCNIQSNKLNFTNNNLTRLLTLMVGQLQANQPDGNFARLDVPINDAIRQAVENTIVNTGNMIGQAMGIGGRNRVRRAARRQNGGLIYAQEGTLVNYQSRGTDTVPAMLTPGEFVINRDATQKNLPLLKAINSGFYQEGGEVDVTKQSNIETAKGSLLSLLSPYTSGEEGRIRLQELMSGDVMSNISASVNTKQKPEGFSSGKNISFNKNMVSTDLLRHELGHSLQVASGSYFRTAESAPVSAMKFFKKFIMTSDYQKNSGYSFHDIHNQPAEILPLLLQFMNNSSFKRYGGDIALKDSMKALGFASGGMVYAQNGSNEPIPRVIMGDRRGDFTTNQKYAQEYVDQQEDRIGELPEVWLYRNYPGAYRDPIRRDYLISLMQNKLDARTEARARNKQFLLTDNTGKYSAYGKIQMVKNNNDGEKVVIIDIFDPVSDKILKKDKEVLYHRLSEESQAKVNRYEKYQRATTTATKIDTGDAKQARWTSVSQRISIKDNTGKKSISGSFIGVATGSSDADTIKFLREDGKIVSIPLGRLSTEDKDLAMERSRINKPLTIDEITGRETVDRIPRQFSKGGVVYAQNGMMIPYQPKGTDTVPAMLTPGEFVINREATQRHLPLLKSINDGHYQNGGIVSYFPNGGTVRTYSEIGAERRQRYAEEMQRRRDAYVRAKTEGTSVQQQLMTSQPILGLQPQITIAPQQAMIAQASQAAFNPQLFGNVNQQFTILGTLLTGINQGLAQFNIVLGNIQQPGAIAQGPGNNPNGVNNGIANFVQKFDNFIQQLQQIQIPQQINLAMAPTRITVDITGAQLLSSLQPAIQGVILSQIDGAMKNWVANNFDGMSPPNFGVSDNN